MSKYTYPEIAADCYKIIRANQDLNKQSIIRKLKNHFKGIDFEKVKISVIELSSKTK